MSCRYKGCKLRHFPHSIPTCHLQYRLICSEFSASIIAYFWHLGVLLFSRISVAIVVQSNAMIAFDLRYVYGRFGFDPTVWKWEILPQQACFKHPSFCARLEFGLSPPDSKPKPPLTLSFVICRIASDEMIFTFSGWIQQKQQYYLQIIPLRSAPSSAFSSSLFFP